LCNEKLQRKWSEIVGDVTKGADYAHDGSFEAQTAAAVTSEAAAVTAEAAAAAAAVVAKGTTADDSGNSGSSGDSNDDDSGVLMTSMQRRLLAKVTRNPAFADARAWPLHQLYMPYYHERVMRQQKRALVRIAGFSVVFCFSGASESLSLQISRLSYKITTLFYLHIQQAFAPCLVRAQLRVQHSNFTTLLHACMHRSLVYIFAHTASVCAASRARSTACAEVGGNGVGVARRCRRRAPLGGACRGIVVANTDGACVW
jgi:hypothetical protein